VITARLAIVVLAVTLLAIGGCDDDYVPVLSATDLAVVAPLPGKSTSVAYVTLHNNSNQDVVLDSASSPGFASVEIHETVVIDDVARMNRIDSLTIAANSSLVLAPGGKHIMLMKPQRDREPGDPVTLELHYNQGELLLLQAPLQNRADFRP
jgi:copper(I)-binding protein